MRLRCWPAAPVLFTSLLLAPRVHATPFTAHFAALVIHTGECEVQGRNLAGMAVHIAARVQAAAAAGGILVTSTVRDLAVGSGLRFEGRGGHSLKGVPDEWWLFALAD